MKLQDITLPAPRRHTRLEDVHAILTGCAFAVFGLILLKSAGLATGGMAGLALILSCFLPLPVGLLFALLNIPFFGLVRELGALVLLRAVLATFLICVFAVAAPFAFSIDRVNGIFAALFGGTTIGVGLLLLMRHHVGVGGLGLLALAWQRSRGWNAGRTMLIGDALILCAAVPVLKMDVERFALSVLSAAATAGVLIIFHKPGRYTGF